MERSEIIFEVTEAAEGGYIARALGHSIFAHGDDWTDLKAMVREAVLCHFDPADAPRVIRLHWVWLTPALSPGSEPPRGGPPEAPLSVLLSELEGDRSDR